MEKILDDFNKLCIFSHLINKNFNEGKNFPNLN